jgi:hypothetical protein
VGAGRRRFSSHDDALRNGSNKSDFIFSNLPVQHDEGHIAAHRGFVQGASFARLCYCSLIATSKRYDVIKR